MILVAYQIPYYDQDAVYDYDIFGWYLTSYCLIYKVICFHQLSYTKITSHLNCEPILLTLSFFRSQIDKFCTNIFSSTAKVFVFLLRASTYCVCSLLQCAKIYSKFCNSKTHLFMSCDPLLLYTSSIYSKSP